MLLQFRMTTQIEKQHQEMSEQWPNQRCGSNPLVPGFTMEKLFTQTGHNPDLARLNANVIAG